MMRTSRLVATTIFLLAAPLAASGDPAAEIDRLVTDTGPTTRVTVDPATGAARFIRFEPGSAEHTLAPTGGAAARAMGFFRGYGGVFGITDADSQLEAVRTTRDGLGGWHATFRQVHEGIPVFGGELRVHFDGHRRLFVVNGTFVTGLKLDMTPRLTRQQAAQLAIHRVLQGPAAAEKRPFAPAEPKLAEDAELTAAASDLMVFRSGLLRGVSGRDHLVYEVEVVNEAITVREFVYVDAHSGRVIDQITGIHTILDREVSETTLANVIWDESNGDPTTLPPGWAGGTPQQVTDWQNEIDGAGETYNLIASINAGAYDSNDNAGATMRTVNNDPGIFCPNANWNGVSTNYCSGVTGDDTVAHEWGHAYTDFTNNLIYQWQSGALNESYSDIWGEVVDLLNGRGTDAPGGPRSTGGCSVFGAGAPSVDNTFRWLSGEDDLAFGGAIRDMWNPTCYNDPGKVTDTAQYICSTFDSGGVHINSGIPNHAFALMVDGGTYNGFTITGLGLTKAAHIHWGAQNLLSVASNFVDQADALDAACASLTGVNLPALSTSVPNAGPSGIVIAAADCAEVDKINQAVEFRTPPTFCNFQPLLAPDAPALCEGLGSVQTTAFEDFEGGSLPAGWSASSHDVVSPGTFDSPGWSVVGSLPDGAGGSFAAFAPDLIAGDCVADIEAGAVALDSPAIVLPVGEVPHVVFDHWVATEAGWDGANLKLSVNGGPFDVVPGSAYTFNSYNDAIIGGANDNPLADEEAFTGSDGGSNLGSWGQSQVDLFGLAFPGDTVQLRFDLGTDGCNGLFGWYVDSVQVYSCSAEQPPMCGDGKLDMDEECDDGNADDGDGCSSTCQVEDGWVCEDPTPPSPGTNVIADGSFEAGPFGGIWAESSTNFGTPICDVPTCGAGTGTGPSDGDFWAWFGGIAAYEAGSVSQSVVIPATATDLSFDLEQIVCDSGADYMELTVDGNQEFLTDGTSGLCGTLGYSGQTVDVSAYADGGAHTVAFSSESFANNGGVSNFFVDRVVLSDNVPVPGTPSVCRLIVEDLVCNGGAVDYIEGIPDSWTVVDNEGTGLVWTDIAGSFIGGNWTGASGDAASASSDAFPFTEFDTELISNSFSLENAASASLDYVVNYQNLSGLDFLDVDVSTDGGGSWTNLLSWNEDHPPGGLFTPPGEAVSLDLAAYLGESDVQVRWHYYDPNFGDWDWYAQVDDVALTCNLEPDCDGATASPDLLWPPNHKYRAITIEVIDPDGDPVTVTVDSIFQDESVNGLGNGNTSPDGRGVGTSTAEVRAERSGKGDGRVYHIAFTADDGRGGTCSGEVLVGVPHDMGQGSVPIDGGALFDSTAEP